LSKSITGIALAKLVSEGRLNISHQITQYMPDLPAHYKQVTVAQLISHTAGVRHYKNNEWMKVSATTCKTAMDAIGVFINDPLEFEPGKEYSYSSFGYVLLSAMVEAITQTPFDEYVRAEVFLPAGVRDIALDKTAEAESAQTVHYEKWNQQSAKAKVAPVVNNSCKFGGGGFVGSARALATLQLAMLNGKIVTGDALTQYYTSFSRNDGQPVNYGFGIGVGESNGMKYHTHTGSAVGANGVMIIYPKEKVVVVLLGNLDDEAMNNVAGKLGRLFF
jgi:serine beta-lactamase-like protein LACTB, mitochondrial